MEQIPFFQKLINLFLLRKSRTNHCFDKLVSCVEEGSMDAFLSVLLELMSLVLLVDPSFRQNIKNFDAQYVFSDKAGQVCVTAVFKNNKLRVVQGKGSNPNLTLIFKDGSSLFKLLMSGTPDVLTAILDQEVDFSGNMNYLNKFAYMATHLWLSASGKLAA